MSQTSLPLDRQPRKDLMESPETQNNGAHEFYEDDEVLVIRHDSGPWSGRWIGLVKHQGGILVPTWDRGDGTHYTLTDSHRLKLSIERARECRGAIERGGMAELQKLEHLHPPIGGQP